MYEVFPAYDKLTCWEDEIHGGTGPTLAGPSAAASPAAAGGASMQQQEAADAGRWSGEDMAVGRPLAQQRRRLRGSALEAAEEEGEEEQQGGPYLFDFEKKPAKLLAFVSGAACSMFCAQVASSCTVWTGCCSVPSAWRHA